MTQDQLVEQLKQIRNVTKNYQALRGLQGVPFGVVLLILAVFELGWLHLADPWIEIGLLALLVGISVACYLYTLIGNFYDRRFGRVQRMKKEKLDTVIEALATLVLIFAGMRIDNNLNLPISATGLALALWFFVCWWRTNAFRTHILALAILTALLSLLPLTGLATPISKVFIPGHGGYELTFSLLLIVGGIADHLLLQRTFRRTQRTYHDQTI